jgi:branched-chain amino acid transport system permease protein
VGVLLAALGITMLACGAIGVGIERFLLRPLRAVKGPAAMILTIGVSYVLFNIVILGIGADSKNFPNPLPPVAYDIGGAVLRMREILIWVITVLLMGGLTYFVGYTKLGKAMRATAQDPEAARMMGIEVDQVIMTAFFLGAALAGAGGMIFGLYYNYTSFLIGFSAGLRAFTAAVLGGIGNVPGAMLGGLLIGLIEAFSGAFIATAWTDVIIFSLLVLILVFRPAGLLGRVAPNKS